MQIALDAFGLAVCAMKHEVQLKVTECNIIYTLLSKWNIPQIKKRYYGDINCKWIKKAERNNANLETI